MSSKIRGFFGVAAMKEFNANQALIITLDKDSSLKTDRGEVPAISFWKWALSKA